MAAGVLVVTFSYPPDIGGQETHTRDLCEYLGKRDYAVWLMTHRPLVSREKTPRIETSNNLRVYRVPWFGKNWVHRLDAYPPVLFAYLFPGLFVGTSLFMLKNRRKVDVIHGHGIVGATVALILGGIFRKRKVVTLHTIFRLEKRPALAGPVGAILKKMDKVLVLSPAASKELEDIKIPREKIDVIPNWVNQDVFKPSDKDNAKRSLGLEGRFVFLFVGRFHEAKEVRLLLDAAALLDEKEGITFLFVGSGPMLGDIEKEAQRNRSIKLHGPVENKLLPPIFSAADLTWADADVDYLGRTAVESLFCGVPALLPDSIRVMGVTKPMDQGKFREELALGILSFVSCEPQALVEKVRQASRSREALLKAADTCREFSVSRFGVGVAHLIERSYERI